MLSENFLKHPLDFLLQVINENVETRLRTESGGAPCNICPQPFLGDRSMLVPVIPSMLIQASTILLLDNLFKVLAQDQHKGDAKILPLSSFEDGDDICSLPFFEGLSSPPEVFEDF